MLSEQNKIKLIELFQICTKCGLPKLLKYFSIQQGGRFGKKSICKACRRIYHENYRNVNKDIIKGRNKIYRQNNKEAIAKRKKQHQQDNKEALAAKKKEYRKNHKKEITILAKQYQQSKGGKIVIQEGQHRRRALKMGADYEIFDRIEIFERDQYICQRCGRKTRPDYRNVNHPLSPNLDHIMPLSLGGAHTRVNTQCLCRQCNATKGNTGVGDQLRIFG